MKRVILVLVCSLSLFATASFAQHDTDHADGGAGFHDIAAPLGLRWWFAGQKVGLDLGVGFGSDPTAIDPNDTVIHYAFDVGLPIVMHSWEGVHVLFRPGILYTSQEEGFDSDPGPGFVFDTDNATRWSIRAEVEGELFLRTNFSVSASHGLEFVTDKAANTTPGAPNPSSQSSFATIGRQLTEVGFHLYFLGAHK